MSGDRAGRKNILDDVQRIASIEGLPLTIFQLDGIIRPSTPSIYIYIYIYIYVYVYILMIFTDLLKGLDTYLYLYVYIYIQIQTAHRYPSRDQGGTHETVAKGFHKFMLWATHLNSFFRR